MTLLRRYEEICADVDAEFARNRRLYGDKLRCRAGCSDCCQQLFQITEIEAAQISQGVKTLPADVRARMVERAGPYLGERRKLVARTGEPEAWGRLPPRGTRLACPALENGVCQIYALRPLVCRKYGIPLFNPKKPDQVLACELNFSDGDEIVDEELVPRQTDIYLRWQSLQADYNAAGLRREAEPLTVARALLEDFSALAADDPQL